ncbi:unnamed protein product [Rangifer tarandus platyrhynchus]|uniref:Uncharacterized protein n=1 Tax=Rangifer tarandus platyrhynchus TaxID=3082113 RepID=A0ABN8YS34_RANTA|nr:unnamed protein product [Rangifer tarandus platyrhynchus]
MPSPEAREATAGLQMGHMAGDRPGGTAKWWGWAAGTLPGPQPHSCSCQNGGQEQPQQQAEASVRVGEGRGSPHLPGTSPVGRASSVYGPGPVKAETTPLERPHP